MASLPQSRSSRSNKYGAKRTVLDGISFHSIGESKRYAELKLLERAGEIRELELQKPYDLSINGIHICTYIADFRYIEKGSGLVVEDSKGFRTREYLIKRNLMKAIYGIEIRETGRQKTKRKTWKEKGNMRAVSRPQDRGGLR